MDEAAQARLAAGDDPLGPSASRDLPARPRPQGRLLAKAAPTVAVDLAVWLVLVEGRRLPPRSLRPSPSVPTSPCVPIPGVWQPWAEMAETGAPSPGVPTPAIPRLLAQMGLLADMAVLTGSDRSRALRLPPSRRSHPALPICANVAMCANPWGLANLGRDGRDGCAVRRRANPCHTPLAGTHGPLGRHGSVEGDGERGGPRFAEPLGCVIHARDLSRVVGAA